MTKEHDADKLARACAESMWANDSASKGLGMAIEEVRLGYARLSMPIRADMTNGQKIAHGGFIFTLADSAFAFACNGRNQFTVAQHCAVTFLAPGFEGDVMTATAQERHFAGRSGIYDVTVTNQKSETIAEFRGHSRTVKGQHLPDPETPDA
ncbi:hydroxyphenylacetyl-CoA thioesterase PaaI [Pseudahrensia aquimaris]|uniref:Hydroxyphenylacetyl-CoA thioesterase PaaI n=1 Tax=Pseudahrensia aquimaris TaxID=744461 RepID=A0ABW3FCV2_9HYPH